MVVFGTVKDKRFFFSRRYFSVWSKTFPPWFRKTTQCKLVYYFSNYAIRFARFSQKVELRSTFSFLSAWNTKNKRIISETTDYVSYISPARSVPRKTFCKWKSRFRLFPDKMLFFSVLKPSSFLLSSVLIMCRVSWGILPFGSQ